MIDLPFLSDPLVLLLIFTGEGGGQKYIRPKCGLQGDPVPKRRKIYETANKPGVAPMTILRHPKIWCSSVRHL